MRHSTINSLLFATFLIFSTPSNPQNGHYTSPSAEEENELSCDFIYARYYQALAYIQDKLSSATTITENGGREKFALENRQFRVYFFKNKDKIYLLELTLKLDHFKDNAIPYFIKNKVILKNKEHKFFCENDTGRAIFDNKKIQSIIIHPNFIE
ncbi:hypothetical protein [Massilia sp. erpn]|uniref:hypothetical protein n=1 Tax=Massilia sp. erpn TaxID=2738142 RepID=UPI002104C286|nr:hypothetical protein [Massilia sp. erpn]UTY58718.1 hypothetical protein HPQ68_16900 [Massilia sp. erpn]